MNSNDFRLIIEACVVGTMGMLWLIERWKHKMDVDNLKRKIAKLKSQVASTINGK
jgi:hypothetical protein